MSRPVGVTVLAVLGYLIVAWCLLVAVLVTFEPDKLIYVATQFRLGRGFSDLGGFGFRIAIAVIFVAIAALEGAVSRGLWRLAPWARDWTIVLCTLSLLFGGGLFLGRLLSILSVAYLLGGEAKRAFGVEYHVLGTMTADKSPYQ